MDEGKSRAEQFISYATIEFKQVQNNRLPVTQVRYRSHKF